ncbi:aldehyde dehydrogenase family protein [Kribbella solani]|uniref:1-pyrroline dehydrogenase n=1 Tax=Kribbella solani TaxID=236067 RepID=A0A841DSZ2_9ACTN|nr:aldehyde dehydrogenase family protein [Kribbella solani]MBB5980005.1 1-pyrroline dehydrogenase [Kribbella solani]
MTTVPAASHWIGGKPSHDAVATIPVIDPASGNTVLDLPVASAAVVDEAVRDSRAAFGTWGRAPHSYRAAKLLELADVLTADLDNLVGLESLDVGKPEPHARQEITWAIDLIRFAAGAGRALESLSAGEYVPGKTSFVRREPLGVIAGITPWNYPMVMLAYKTAAALAAGNTLVLKPAEQTPLTTIRVGELAGQVLGDGVLNVVLGDGETTGASMVAHPDVALVTLTGDTSTGRIVARSAAETLKRTVLELGGKSPVLVFGDADLDLVADGIRKGGFYNSGQDCTAASRVIAHADVYDELAERLREGIAGITVGAPADEPEMGPVVSAEQRERVLGFVERADAAGAKVTVGGTAVDRPGYFVTPTLVEGPAQDAEIVQREVFGPVVTIQRAGDEDEMVAMANGTAYGLGASVWTRNVGRAVDVSGRIDAGAVWVNCHDVVTPEMPHGGVRASGYGKDLSLYSIAEMTHLKHVMVDHER